MSFKLNRQVNLGSEPLLESDCSDDRVCHYAPAILDTYVVTYMHCLVNLHAFVASYICVSSASTVQNLTILVQRSSCDFDFYF